MWNKKKLNMKILRAFMLLFVVKRKIYIYIYDKNLQLDFIISYFNIEEFQIYLQKCK
jgi:hypothetical protein